MGSTHKRILSKNQILFGFLVLLIFLTFTSNGDANSSLSMSFQRNFGADTGTNKIRGQYTITGKGGSDIVLMTLFFNDVNVSSSVGNELKFKFDTTDFEVGLKNITLIGWDQAGNQYQKTEEYTFTDATIPTLIAVGAIMLGAISIFFKYKKRKKNTTAPPIQKKDIEIS
jgi:hypothetical protein